MSYQDALKQIIEDVISPSADEVDRTGAFPTANISALAEAGVLALTVPAESGGGGLGVREAADVVRQISMVCGSTAMIVTMHYSATAILVATDRADALSQIVSGQHVSTLAFSETGSRSHFWAPVSSATVDGESVVLDARKSWVTSAHSAASYVWSSRPIDADGPMTLWFVPAGTRGLSIPSTFDGLGLRGNDSSPVSGEGARIPHSNMLGADGTGLDTALAVALPWFLLLNASASVGLMQAVVASTTQHLVASRLQHLDQSLAQQQPSRARLARMRLKTDLTDALVNDTLTAIEQGRPDAQLRVLEVKAASDENAAEVADLAMLACGGAAFRKELNIERRFRDSRAARMMAPTTDALLDFIGRALCGLPLLDGAEA